GAGKTGRDHRVTGVVIGGRSGDRDAVAHRPRCTGESCGLLLVVTLGDERRTQPESLRLDDLVDEISRRPGLAGQRVEAQFPQDRRIRALSYLALLKHVLIQPGRVRPHAQRSSVGTWCTRYRLPRCLMSA